VEGPNKRGEPEKIEIKKAKKETGIDR